MDIIELGGFYVFLKLEDKIMDGILKERECDLRVLYLVNMVLNLKGIRKIFLSL